MASTEQEARNRKPLQQMLALKPRVEFGLMAGTAIVPDREFPGVAQPSSGSS
jgi:hypothetical protein